MKRMLIVALLCFVISACTSQRMTSKATPELTADHISGWVVYSKAISSESTVVQIFLKNLDTGEVTQLTNSGNNDWARWSPDGSQILFTSWTEENRNDIYLMDKDGKNQIPIIATNANEVLPDWSPDGKKIVFISNQDGNDEVYLMDLITKEVKKLTDTTKFAYLPTWSTDGKHIAFASSTDGVGRSQIFIMNSDGTNIRQITNYDVDNFDGDPVWCPDDTCIIFRRDEGGVGTRLLLLDLNSQITSPLLGNVFKSDLIQVLPARSPKRGYITFIVDDVSYAMDMKTKEIYPLDVKGALDISLYP